MHSFIARRIFILQFHRPLSFKESGTLIFPGQLCSITDCPRRSGTSGHTSVDTNMRSPTKIILFIVFFPYLILNSIVNNGAIREFCSVYNFCLLCIIQKVYKILSIVVKCSFVHSLNTRVFQLQTMRNC